MEQTSMNRLLVSLALAMGILVMQVLGPILAFDVARLFSPNDRLGPGFFIIFYVVLYGLPVYTYLWWRERRMKKSA